MVSGTSSCSLSKTAVAPITYKPDYKLLINGKIAFSLVYNGKDSLSFLNLAYSSSDIYRMAISNVLRPILEKRSS